PRRKQAGEQRRQGKLAAELERVDERIGRKLVRERAHRGVVRGRTGEAASAKRAARRSERAARTGGIGRPGQLGFACLAKKSGGCAAAEEAGASEHAGGKGFQHAIVRAMWTVAQLARDLDAGRTTSRALVEQALERIADPSGEGARAFVHVDAEGARAEADHADALRKRGIRRSPVDGLPVSPKDLFDVAGEVTRAGSVLLGTAPPAGADAAAVARLRAAGAVFVGRTNMVEFAFGGVGTNPHFGTPKNPWDRATARVPGGSTSGGAVAAADG